MTHLKIELNNGVIEEVSGDVITKLYDIVHSGNLDNTSNLIGRLHTSATYQDYIDYLEDAFKVNGVKLLIIDATKKYLTFADPVVASYWANSTYGDGAGIDIAAINNVLNIPNNAFKDNTSIQTFNELGSFINCTSIGNNSFLNCTALTSINLSNCTSIGESAFNGCTALTTVTGSNLTSMGINAFYGCTSLINIDFSNNIDFRGTFDGCSSLGLNQDLDMNLDGKTFGSNAFRNTGYKTITLHETTEHKITNFAGSGQYDAFGARMANLTKLDLSDTKQTGSTGALYANAMTTLIYPETQTSLSLLGRDYGNHLLYIVCLSRNIGDISDNPGGWTWYGMPSSCAIYIQDDIFDTYMQMTGWAAQEGAGRVKKISQLPSNVTWYTKSNS